MSEAAKRIDLRVGDLAISVQGGEDPLRTVKQLLRFVQRLVEETPEMLQAGFALDDATLDALLADLRARDDLPEGEFDAIPGLILTVSPETAEDRAAGPPPDEAVLASGVAAPAWDEVAAQERHPPQADADGFADDAIADGFADDAIDGDLPDIELPEDRAPAEATIQSQESMAPGPRAADAPAAAGIAPPPSEPAGSEGWPPAAPAATVTQPATPEDATGTGSEAEEPRPHTLSDLSDIDPPADEAANRPADPEEDAGPAMAPVVAAEVEDDRPRPMPTDSLAAPVEEIPDAEPEPQGAPDTAPEPEPAPNIFARSADSAPSREPPRDSPGRTMLRARPEAGAEPVSPAINIFARTPDETPESEAPGRPRASDPGPAEPEAGRVNIFAGPETGSARPVPDGPRWIEDPDEPAPDLEQDEPAFPAAGEAAGADPEPEAEGSRFADLVARYRGRSEPEPAPDLYRAAAPEPAPERSRPAPTTSAETLAARAGAGSVPELLAASAAWLTLVGQRGRFSRREVMEVFDSLPGDHPRSLEARIKGYGKLVRMGSLVLVDDGLFALSEEERARYRALLD